MDLFLFFKIKIIIYKKKNKKIYKFIYLYMTGAASVNIIAF